MCNKSKVLALTVVGTFMVLSFGACLLIRGQSTQMAAGREAVVVELFTSEGCSSCPPADALLAELDTKQPLGSADIIAIEEHVDYWDELGWKDPYSSSAWTARQNDYAGTLRNGSAYTPQMVVDGTTGFVGNRGGTARQEIEKAATNRKARIEISQVSLVENKAVTLKVNIEKSLRVSPKDTAEVIVVITESGLRSSVKGGENNGKDLQHSPVLREFRVIGTAGKSGEEEFTAQPSVKLDAKWNAANLRAVVFIQEKKSRRILGAATIRLTQPNLPSR